VPPRPTRHQSLRFGASFGASFASFVTGFNSSFVTGFNHGFDARFVFELTTGSSRARDTRQPPRPQTPAATPSTPAIAPPAPNMLDDLRATPLASPYAAPYPGAGTLSRSYGASWGLESSADGASTDEPLWVLPEQFIPKAPVGVPGARMTRDRGYLDTPDTIAGISREPLERDSGQLEAGLGWDYCGPRPASVPAQPRPQPWHCRDRP
jgi:hypothetical protein